jgi:flagellar hook-basal body complex protein FliE
MSVINPISAVAGDLASVSQMAAKNKSVSPGAAIGDFIESVNQLQSEAGALQKSLYSDQPTELHRVMIAAQQAGTAMELLVEIRNQLVEAYQELMRMPV